MTKIIAKAATLSLSLAAPVLAHADTPEPAVSERAAPAVSIAPEGMALSLGGGVTGYTRSETRDALGTGGYWDLRAVYGTRSYLGAELAYIGTAREAAAGGLSQDAFLMGNGFEATARANLPLEAGRLRVAPFVFGGVGWSWLQVGDRDSNDDWTSKEEANALTIPFGAGVNLAYQRFTVEARFTYRPTFQQELKVLERGGDEPDLQNWSAGLTVGYEF